jgi:hypothetical protein
MNVNYGSCNSVVRRENPCFDKIQMLGELVLAWYERSESGSLADELEMNYLKWAR